MLNDELICERMYAGWNVIKNVWILKYDMYVNLNLLLNFLNYD